MKFKTCTCGSTKFYMLQRIKGYCNFYVDQFGEPTDNGGIHDGLEYKDVRKHYRCAICDKKAKLEID